MIITASIRLIADSQADAEAAITELRNYVGSARIALNSPTRGRRSDQWLAYGTFQFDREAPATVVVPAPATGKTRKLRKP